MLGATALAACTDDTAPPEPTASADASASSPEESPPDEPLRLAVFGEPGAVRAYRDIGAAFAEEQGRRVEVEVYGDRAQAVRRLERSLGPTSPPSPDGSGSSAPPSAPSRAGETSAADDAAPDVFLVDSVDLPALLPTGRLHPVDDDLEERGLQFGDGYQRLALTAFSADDRLQCMPVEISPHVMFVNPEYVRPRDLETRGVPLPDEGRWAFDDFAAAARVIAREHEDDPRFRAVHLPYDIRVLAAFIRSAGGEIVDDVDEPTTLTFDGEEAREALTAYLTLARQRRVALTTAAEDDPQALARFARGEIAMRFGTRADVPFLRRSGVRFDVMPLPDLGSSRTVADITGLCVDQESDRLEAALDLVAFAAGAEGSATLGRSGAVLPANLDVAFGPVFAQRGQPPRSTDVFLDALGRSGLMPFSPVWRGIAERVETVVADVEDDRRSLPRLLERRLPRLDERSQKWFAPASEEAEEEEEPERDS